MLILYMYIHNQKSIKHIQLHIVLDKKYTLHTYEYIYKLTNIFTGGSLN